MAFAASGLHSNCRALFTQPVCTSVNSLATVRLYGPFLLFMQHCTYVCVTADSKLFVVIQRDSMSL